MAAVNAHGAAIMAVYRFKDVRGFEAAMGQGRDFERFTVTPVLATEWLGLSSLAVADLIGSGGVDVVMTDDGHTFLDADELVACERRPAESVAGNEGFTDILAT